MPVKPATKRARGKSFEKGFDPRRNLKGPVPGVWELKQEIVRDGRVYVDQLFRKAMKGDAVAIRYALDHAIGAPAVTIRLEQELKRLLRVLKAVLPPESYELALRALTSEAGDGGTPTAGSEPGEDEATGETEPG